MQRSTRLFSVLFAAFALLYSPLAAAESDDYLQCVPFARDTSGIQIYGDAHTWWGQANGKYERGNVPVKGAVVAFKPHGAMQLGHVATITRIVDSRTVLISHANWSTINGRRGQIERNVKMVDVSQGNDWSVVRVWYTPIGALGGSSYPIHGFIYSGKAPRMQRDKPRYAKTRKPSRKFLAAMQEPTRSKPARQKREKRSKRANRNKPEPLVTSNADPIADLISESGR